MSHTTEMTTSYKVSGEAELIAALKARFGEDSVEVHDDLTQMLMFNGETSAPGYGEAGKAHIIVRSATLDKDVGRKAWTNDLGFVRGGDGNFVLLADDRGFPKEAQNKVADDYTARVTMKQLKKQGYTVKRVEEKGVISIKASRYQ